MISYDSRTGAQTSTASICPMGHCPKGDVCLQMQEKKKAECTSCPSAMPDKT